MKNSALNLPQCPTILSFRSIILPISGRKTRLKLTSNYVESYRREITAFKRFIWISSSSSSTTTSPVSAFNFNDQIWTEMYNFRCRGDWERRRERERERGEESPNLEGCRWSWQKFLALAAKLGIVSKTFWFLLMSNLSGVFPFVM